MNRYLLARLRDVDWSKVTIAAKLLRRRFEIYPYRGTLKGYLTDLARPPQRDDVAALESDLRYELVLSCVDNNMSGMRFRTCIHASCLVASASGLRAMVVDYDMRSPYQCLKCWNPLPPWHDALQALTRDLRKMTPAERAAWAQKRGLNAAAIERRLADPKCGEIGERELSRFTTSEQPMFSIEFVSAAAGLLLAARLLRIAIDGYTMHPANRGPSLVFSLASARALLFSKPRAASCTCNHIGRRLYADQWRMPVPA